jgi:hypothetical protein
MPSVVLPCYFCSILYPGRQLHTSHLPGSARLCITAGRPAVDGAFRANALPCLPPHGCSRSSTCRSGEAECVDPWYCHSLQNTLFVSSHASRQIPAVSCMKTLPVPSAPCCHFLASHRRARPPSGSLSPRFPQIWKRKPNVSLGLNRRSGIPC